MVGYRPMAMMTCGSIIGATIRAPTSGIQRRPPRVTASAPSVPNSIDSIAVAAPIWMLFHAARIQRPWFQTSIYQRSARRVGGNARSSWSVNDISTTTSTGAIRNTTSSARAAPAAERPATAGTFIAGSVPR